MNKVEGQPFLSRPQCLKLLASGVAAPFPLNQVHPAAVAVQKDPARSETDGLTVRVATEDG